MPDFDGYGKRDLRIVSFEKAASELDELVLNDYMQSDKQFGLKVGHIIALQNFATQLKVGNGVVYDQWLSYQGEMEVKAEFMEKVNKLKANILLKFSNFDDIEILIRQDHPFVRCPKCSEYLKATARCSTKSKKVTRYDSTGVVRHINCCNDAKKGDKQNEKGETQKKKTPNSKPEEAVVQAKSFRTLKRSYSNEI